MDNLPTEILDYILCIVADDALVNQQNYPYLDLLCVNKRWRRIMSASKNLKPFLVAHLNKTTKQMTWPEFASTYEKTFSNPLFSIDEDWFIMLFESFMNSQLGPRPPQPKECKLMVDLILAVTKYKPYLKPSISFYYVENDMVLYNKFICFKKNEWHYICFMDVTMFKRDNPSRTRTEKACFLLKQKV